LHLSRQWNGIRCINNMNNAHKQSLTKFTVRNSTVAAVKHPDTTTTGTTTAPLPPFALPFVTSGNSRLPLAPQTQPPAASFLLPTKHSRQRLPAVITDWTQLTDLAAEILSTETGRLFSYDINVHTVNEYSTSSTVHSTRAQSAIRSSRSTAAAMSPQNTEKQTLLSVTASRNVAWHTSYTTVATVEALIRGCAYGIHGTMWQRWVPVPPASAPEAASSSSNSLTNADPTDLMQLQQSLLNRLYNEGHAYMTLRSLQLTERYGEKVASTTRDVLSTPDSISTPSLLERSSHVTTLQSSHSSQSSSMLYDNDENNALVTNSGDGERADDAYVHEFALPGPTIAMYDTMLDTLASYCSFLQEQQQQQQQQNGHNATMETTLHVLEMANYLHDVAMLRHVTDGGDDANSNPYTRPTAVTFNALMRVAAELPIANGPTATTTTSLSPMIRDDAITTALATFQALNECGVVHRNTASYVYALRAVTKYLPPCRIRNNIVAGLVSQARYHGLLSVDVVAAYRAALDAPLSQTDNEASVPRYQNVTAAAALLDDPNMPPEQWPPKWKRHSRKRQYHPREAIY
jgi:hypothetical protein